MKRAPTSPYLDLPSVTPKPHGQKRLERGHPWVYSNELRLDAAVKALNDQTRRDIVELLKKGDLTAGEIADHFDISKPSISHHLDLLKQADIVTSVKQGQFIYYSRNTTVLDEIVAWFLGLQNKKKKFFYKSCMSSCIQAKPLALLLAEIFISTHLMMQ